MTRSISSLLCMSLLGARGIGAAQSAGAGLLRTWMGGLEVPLPANTSAKLPMAGPMTIRSGSCWDIRLGNIETIDNSSGQVLGFGVNVTGIEVVCHAEVEMEDGDLIVNISIGTSTFEAAILIEPTTSDLAPEYPLPLGQMTLTSCMSGLVVSNITMAGSSMFAKLGVFDDNWTQSQLADMVAGFLNDELCPAMTNYIATNGTDQAAFAAMIVSPMLMPPLPLDEPEPLKPVVNWGEYPPIVVVQALVAERFGSWVPRIIDALDKFSFDEKLLSTDFGNMSLVDVGLAGPTSKDHPSMALHARETHVGATTKLGALNISTAFGLNVSLYDNEVLRHRIQVTLALDNVSAGVRAHMDRKKLDNMKINQVMQSPRCLLDCAAGTTDPESESIAVEQMGVGMLPLLRLDAEGALETQVFTFVNTVLAALFAGYLPSVNALANGGLAFALLPVNGMLWDEIDKLGPCTGASMLMGMSDSIVRFFWIGSATIAALGLAVAAVNHILSKRRAAAAARAREVTEAKAVDVSNPCGEQPCTAEASEEVCFSQQRSLSQQPIVPRGLAVFYPIAAASVMLLFLYADFGLAATVEVRMRSAQEETVIGPVFKFSLMSTIVHSWDGKAYFIAIATVLMSGIWPFVKLAILLVAWHAPPGRLPLARRARALKFLDTLGKYSFVDSWFLVLSMSAFAIEWVSAGGEGQEAMALITNPRPAFYAFFIATGASLILGHIASEYHTEVLAREAAQRRLAVEAEMKVTYSQFEALALQKAPLAAQGTTRMVRWGAPAAVLTSLVLTFMGTFMQSLEFHVYGIFADYIFGKPIDATLSLWTMGTGVTRGRGSDAGLIALGTVFLLLSVILPVVLLVMLLVLWLAPMTARNQEGLLRASYFVESWTTIDVIIIVLAIACFEFGTLSEFLVYNSDFAKVCTAFRDLTGTECMAVDLEPRGPLGVLALASVLNLVVPKVVIRLCAAATAERLQSPMLALPKRDMERLSRKRSLADLDSAMKSIGSLPGRSASALAGRSAASLAGKSAASLAGKSAASFHDEVTV